MKRLAGLGALLLLFLTGCSVEVPEMSDIDLPFAGDKSEVEPAAPDSDTDEPNPEATLTTGDAIIPAQTEAPAADSETDVRALYHKTLLALHDEKLLPSGSELAVVGDIEQNRFAVCDIDGDEREELVLEVTQADVNDAFTAVYDVDADGNLRREVRYAAQVTFWSDGIVIASYPDAAEHEGDFVPYAAAQYDPEMDAYTEFAYVSAIDRDTLAANDLLDEYPEDADTSGTGRVYCIRGDNPVDVTEYEAWYASWNNGLTERAVPYKALTTDEIEAILS